LQKYAPLAEEYASRYDHKLYRAIAHRAWGVSHRLAGQYAESQIRFEWALEIFQQMNTHRQVGRTLFELGELAVAQMDFPMASAYFTRARSAFESIQATLDSAYIHATLEKLK
jgi:tetratricopeptide (TPR) repeat protein